MRLGDHHDPIALSTHKRILKHQKHESGRKKISKARRPPAGHLKAATASYCIFSNWLVVTKGDSTFDEGLQHTSYELQRCQ